MENSMFKRGITRVILPACTAFLIGGAVTSCDDDLLTGQPSWLGESIYAELENRGDFKETLKLINAQSEDYASVLQKTGSKTLFAADDEAWARFYRSNPWGVTSLEEMTDAQKKLLFKSNMINSAYLVELLGNIPSTSATSDPIEGSCMRRATSVDLMDSVPVVPESQFPAINPARIDAKTGEQVDYWSKLRGKGSALVLQDDGVASMIHFVPKFMQSNNIKSEDVAFMTNGEITTNDSAFVNGQVISEQDITCQNGYIQVLKGVAMPLENMANVIANQPQFSIYNRLLDRFSYPHYDATVSAEYQRQYGGEDSVYVKRYFNSHGSHPFTTTDDNVTISNQLPYDPGWNRYALYSSSGITYQYDAAAMFVPTDDALMAYLEDEGADLKERYSTSGPGATAWDNAPDAVVLPLLENTMLTSLKSAIPSQFGSVNNTAGENMGVTKADIDSTIWACNGVIYQTNKVYVAPEYVSVYYPCVIRDNEDLHMTYTVVDNDRKITGGEGFYAYLNNMGSKYSFIIPTDNALQTYYDPVSRYRVSNTGTSTALAYKYYVNEAGYIAAYPYLVDWTDLDAYGRGRIDETSTNQVTLSTSTTSSGDVFNHFKDILNSSLSVGLFTPGQRFYQARNGGPIIVDWSGNKVSGVAGSFQYERGYFIPVTESYDKSEEGNGCSYIIEQEPLMSTFTSPYAAITDSLRQDQFGTFARLLDDAEIVATDDGADHATADKAITILNNYHYSIYVPTNESIDALIAAHKMPTGDDIDAVRNAIDLISDEYDQATTTEDSLRLEEERLYMEEQLTAMQTVISNFITYHIQDNSVFVDGPNHSNDVYESACLDTISNRFVKLYVNYELGGQLKITDNMGNVRTVSSDCNNVLARQYYFNGKSLTGNECSQIYSSSFAVIHQIDAPLEPFANCYYSPEAYEKVYAIIAAHASNNGGSTPNPIKRKRR